MEKIIYYHDTDSGGVVYYANYLKYMEEARTEFLRNKGLSPEDGFIYAVRKCTINYRHPARYADIITCDAHLQEMTAAQLFFKQNIYNKKTQELLVEAEIVLVSLTKDFKPCVIPERARKLLST
jgi:tol-pal system-associated acyl-CoA thioesterase